MYSHQISPLSLYHSRMRDLCPLHVLWRTLLLMCCYPEKSENSFVVRGVCMSVSERERGRKRERITPFQERNLKSDSTRPWLLCLLMTYWSQSAPPWAEHLGRNPSCSLWIITYFIYFRDLQVKTSLHTIAVNISFFPLIISSLLTGAVYLFTPHPHHHHPPSW